MKRWMTVLNVILLAVVCARAAMITTTQSGISQVDITNVRVAESTDAKTDSVVSVFAISGSQATPEARTAARSGAHEMAANARLDDKFLFSNTDFSLVLSQSSYTIQLAPDNLFVQNAVVDFVLPPSFLEVTSNVEVPFIFLDTVLLADLRVCFAIACTSSDTQFHLQANLEGSHGSFNWSASATGDPSLDLTPLENPVITDTGGPGLGFIRTTNVAFPLFQGHLDLGVVPVGTPLTLECIMQARVSGPGFGNIGIAAINDPFLLDTDPVQPFDSLTLTLTQLESDVPEPGSWLLCLSGVAIVAWSRKRRLRLQSRLS